MIVLGENLSYKWRNVFVPTPKRISQLLLAIKGVIATIAVSTYFMSHESLAFWLLASGAALDALGQFIGSADEESTG